MQNSPINIKFPWSWNSHFCKKMKIFLKSTSPMNVFHLYWTFYCRSVNSVVCIRISIVEKFGKALFILVFVRYSKSCFATTINLTFFQQNLTRNPDKCSGFFDCKTIFVIIPSKIRKSEKSKYIQKYLFVSIIKLIFLSNYGCDMFNQGFHRKLFLWTKMQLTILLAWSWHQIGDLPNFRKSAFYFDFAGLSNFFLWPTTFSISSIKMSIKNLASVDMFFTKFYWFFFLHQNPVSPIIL